MPQNIIIFDAYITEPDIVSFRCSHYAIDISLSLCTKAVLLFIIFISSIFFDIEMINIDIEETLRPASLLRWWWNIFSMSFFTFSTFFDAETCRVDIFFFFFCIDLSFQTLPIIIITQRFLDTQARIYHETWLLIAHYDICRDAEIISQSFVVCKILSSRKRAFITSHGNITTFTLDFTQNISDICFVYYQFLRCFSGHMSHWNTWWFRWKHHSSDYFVSDIVVDKDVRLLYRNITYGRQTSMIMTRKHWGW